MPTRTFLSLGGNVGHVRETFSRAITLLEAGGKCRLTAQSLVHQTTPVGRDAGYAYSNCVIELESRVTDPFELLALSQGIENELGRVRGERWSARTLDIDLLAVGDLVIESESLTLPHPRAWYRRFVLDPWAEIAPHFVHPVKGLDIESLQTRLSPRPLPIGLAGTLDEPILAAALGRRFPCARLIPWSSKIPADDPAIIFWHDGPDTRGQFDALPEIPRLDLTSDPGTADEAALAALVAVFDWEGVLS